MTKNSTLTEKTFNGLFWMFSGKGFQAVFQFIVTIVLARLLTPNDFGVVSAATVVITFTTMFSMVGVGPAIVQRPNLTELHIRTGYVITILLSVIFTLLMYTFSGLIANFFNIVELINVLKVMSVIFLLKGFSIISESLMQRELRFKLIAGIEVISYFIYAVTGIICALLGFDYWSLVYAQIIQNIVKTFLLIKYQRHNMVPKFDLKSARELLFFGGGYTIAQLSNQIALQADNLVVGKWLGPTALGLYSRAYQLILMPANLFGQVMDNVLFPVMSQIQNKRDQLTQSFRLGITAVAFFTIPVGIMICLLSEEIVIVLFGEAWINLVPALQVLSLGLVFRTGYKISDSLARATGAVYKRALRQIIYAIAVFTGAWVGHHWGIAGVSVGVLFAIIINYCSMTQLSMQFVDLTIVEIIKSHFPGVVLGIFAYLSVFIVKTITNFIFLPAIFIILFSGIIFLLIVLILFRLNIDRILGKEVILVKAKIVNLVAKKVSSK
ncbi:lipopolysaccharide biosynthesis protein [Lederbergia sp. NSJ-179]|uniref:lipopolysaccharide biosynthesis protein n=1 Tax=Lederbergia sp. NSJ-179 TaxID=2931402 RepID=UPI001FD574F5|nr:lipopolysaccharide biosynthesis protein [Lederbergia sp. NSJ-179]MCJ7840676.1 lipopolysaccharide biosynthesis protein [Lederbergia sp. NSJ-179]